MKQSVLKVLPDEKRELHRHQVSLRRRRDYLLRYRRIIGRDIGKGSASRANSVIETRSELSSQDWRAPADESLDDLD
jgi:hypothetical protein